MVSTITSYSLIVFRKKFYFPNDLIIRAPQNLDQVYFPPSRCLTIYEISLRVGLQFFLPSELIDISTTCGVSISQFSYRAMSIVIGLIVFFRDHGEVLTPEFFSHMGRFTCDIQSHRSKSWDSEFFFVKNNWNLIKKWGKLKELPVLLHIGEEDILGDLKILDVKNLLYEICYLSKYIEDDYLFKVGCSCGEDLCNYKPSTILHRRHPLSSYNAHLCVEEVDLALAIPLFHLSSYNRGISLSWIGGILYQAPLPFFM
ncbi:hypothetical protein IEQ34_021558 [Dendrobium chrysotoxum]|uniref:Uncharacterized protein n=1 Tax=Dendrobium chrysotoxum TaxID=161865 RepID=A0AAV7G3E6_DENCH|nr:hypothetical protein IEQ34_021558 [Dendrobium chrysotoxum]